MGIGPMELLLAAVCGIVPIALLGVVGFVVYASSKKANGGGESLALLQEENARLRAENEKLRNGPPGGSPF